MITRDVQGTVPPFFCPSPTCPTGQPTTVPRNFVPVPFVPQTFVARDTKSAGDLRDLDPEIVPGQPLIPDYNKKIFRSACLKQQITNFQQYRLIKFKVANRGCYSAGSSPIRVKKYRKSLPVTDEKNHII